MTKPADMPDDITFEKLTPNERRSVLDMAKRGISRREMMKWALAAGATSLAAGSLFASATKAVAQTPKRGGRLVMAHDAGGPGDTLDPIMYTSGLDYFRGRMFYGSLTRVTENLTAEPELAEEFGANTDLTEWTFKIRKGVEFHDGKTLTADDVVYSMNRHLGKSLSKGASKVEMVREWVKINDYEVVAKLSSAYADLPVALSTPHFKIIKDGQTDFTTTVGTGPYKVQEFKPGVRAIGIPFENYWSEGGYLDELESITIGDGVGRLNAFLAGDVDAMVNLDARSINQVRATPGKEVWSLKSNGYIDVINRLDMQPSGNQDLVKAMQHLVDRERLVKQVYKGEAEIANDQPIGPAYPDYCADIPTRPLDPDKAAFYFKRSGVGSTPIPIIAAEVGPGAVDQCLFMQREGAKIGLNIDVQKVGTDGYWSTVWLKAPICVGNWFMQPTAYMTLAQSYLSSANWNESYWKNEKFDQLLIASRAVSDPAKRKQMFCDIATLASEESGRTIPIYRNFIDAAASHVKGRTHVPLYNFGGAECPPSLWRDEA